jgi:hypothetical protein
MKKIQVQRHTLTTANPVRELQLYQRRVQLQNACPFPRIPRFNMMDFRIVAVCCINNQTGQRRVLVKRQQKIQILYILICKTRKFRSQRNTCQRETETASPLTKSMAEAAYLKYLILSAWN